MFKINPAVYRGVVVLPAEIAEKMLVLTGEKELKTILYVFSRPSGLFDGSELSRALGISLPDARDALAYWEDLGYLLPAAAPAFPDGTKNPDADKSAGGEADAENGGAESGFIPVPAAAVKKRLPDSAPNPTRLSYQDICARAEESEDVRFLLSEAQLSLGRTVGTADQSSLLLLHDYYGLPVEVILSICEYARINGKGGSINYIYTVGADWSRREIDTIEKADEEFKTLERLSSEWLKFISLTGLKAPRPTVQQEKYLLRWLNEWNLSIQLIAKAYDEAAEHTGKLSFSYMNKVLSVWHSEGIRTVEDAERSKREYMLSREQKAAAAGKKQKQKTVSEGGRASYDIQMAENAARTGVPPLKKRGG